MIERIGSLSYVILVLMALSFGNRAIAGSTLHDHQSQSASSQNLRSETPNQWVELGQRVYGGFGSYIALGIRIGLDAMQQLKAEPRQLNVTYYNGVTAYCPCVADGIMIATVSPDLLPWKIGSGDYASLLTWNVVTTILVWIVFGCCFWQGAFNKRTV